VHQIDIDEHLAVPSRYGVLSLPTVMIFAGGEVVETIDGAQPRRRYAEAVARVLGT
jgi:thioredoxin 1